MTPLAAVAAFASASFAQDKQTTTAQAGKLDGYLGVPQERVALDFSGDFAMHVAAWPLLSVWPGESFQTGLGWWRDTRFATATPKFIMGGVALEFVQWANGPGAGKGRDWNKPSGKYGVAQLSPWVIWPPDGLNLKQGTSGELFGERLLAAAARRSEGEDGRRMPMMACAFLRLRAAWHRART